MRPPARIGQRMAEVDTPALVLDLDAFERNLKTLADLARGRVRGFERTVDEDGEGAGWAVVLDGVADKLPVSRRQWAAVKALASG